MKYVLVIGFNIAQRLKIKAAELVPSVFRSRTIPSLGSRSMHLMKIILHYYNDARLRDGFLYTSLLLTHLHIYNYRTFYNFIYLLETEI